MLFVFCHQPSASQASRKKLEAVFGGGDDDDLLGAVPKRKLVRLDEEEALAREENDEAEDKKRIIKSLIEQIPTAKDELFAYSLDWSIVDQVRHFRLRSCSVSGRSRDVSELIRPAMTSQ